MSVQLYQGDCLEILPTLAENSIDLIFADPPYGHSNNDGTDLIGRIGLFRGKEYIQGAKSDGRPIANDGQEANSLFRAVLPEFSRLLVPGGCVCCCCCGGGPDPQFARWSLWLDETPGLEFKQMVVWDKGKMGMGWHYRRSYETVLVAMKKGAACKWYDETNRVENIIRPGDYGIKKIIPSADQHPTQKPVELAAHFIRLHTQPGDIVLDPFAGSYTTGVACVKEQRSFIGIELDAHWHEQGRRRIEQAQQQMRLF